MKNKYAFIDLNTRESVLINFLTSYHNELMELHKRFWYCKFEYIDVTEKELSLLQYYIHHTEIELRKKLDKAGRNIFRWSWNK